jgi:ABC-type multidrug transport system ATPase subunit
MAVAQELCDRIGIIDNGELVQCKPTDELLDLFSDQVFIFRLDRAPEVNGIEALAGVHSVFMGDAEDGPVLTATVASGLEERSEALYGIMEHLRAGGYRVRAINQRQKTLESVFLALTGEQR